MASRPTRAIRVLAVAAIAGQLLFIASWLIAEALEPHYSPVKQAISELGALHARHPWLVNGGLIVLGLSIALVVPGLLVLLPRRKAAVVTGVLFVVAGVGLALSGIFRLDCPLSHHACKVSFDADALSWHTSAHLWAAVVGEVALVLTPFALARALWPSPAAAVSLGAGGVGVLIGAAGEIAYQASAPAGITQRLQLLATYAWIALVAGAILYSTRRAPRAAAATPLRPRDFFASSWAGEGEVAAWPPPLGRLLRASFSFTREASFLTDEVWSLDDRAVFRDGRVERQRTFCQLEAPAQIRVTGDRLPGGAELTLDDSGYRLSRYRYLIEVGPLHFTVHCRDEHRLQDDGTLRSTVRATWLGVPVATLTARARCVDTTSPRTAAQTKALSTAG